MDARKNARQGEAGLQVVCSVEGPIHIVVAGRKEEDDEEEESLVVELVVGPRGSATARRDDRQEPGTDLGYRLPWRACQDSIRTRVSPISSLDDSWTSVSSRRDSEPANHAATTSPLYIHSDSTWLPGGKTAPMIAHQRRQAALQPVSISATRNPSRASLMPAMQRRSGLFKFARVSTTCKDKSEC